MSQSGFSRLRSSFVSIFSGKWELMPTILAFTLRLLVVTGALDQARGPS
jgi:hypothetical protein